jgi:hypothetical protein
MYVILLCAQYFVMNPETILREKETPFFSPKGLARPYIEPVLDIVQVTTEWTVRMIL